MAFTTHEAYGTLVTGLTTELNSLANATNSAASAALDNGTNLDLYGDVELVLAAQGVARSTGATIAVYILPCVDGTNYPDVEPTGNDPWAVFPCDATTTARRYAKVDRPLPPGLFKVYVRNNTGQALAASGNTIKFRPHSVQTV